MVVISYVTFFIFCIMCTVRRTMAHRKNILVGRSHGLATRRKHRRVF
jgi:hypothetical protein